MNAMSRIVVDGLEWYAVRMVAPGNGHRRTAKIGGEKERFKDRSGQTRQRRKAGTGTRVFVPELILKRRGFEVFLPVKKVWRKCHRYTAQRELVAYPLVADWMFIGWPAGESRWHELDQLGVVTGVLGSGGRPSRVRAQTIHRLMSLWGDGVPPALRREVASQVAAGDQVTILSGPFEDFSGPVIDCDSEGARVMLNLFGRETPVAFDLGKVSAPSRAVDATPGRLANGAPACLRCGAAMVLGYAKEKKHHLRCSDCGGVAALNSTSYENALALYEGLVSSGSGE